MKLCRPARKTAGRFRLDVLGSAGSAAADPSISLRLGIARGTAASGILSAALRWGAMAGRLARAAIEAATTTLQPVRKH